jgi:hypothetical protein
VGFNKAVRFHQVQSLTPNSASTSIRRFREVPGFGRDTIRRFGRNVSEMKQFAARNYEDLLQVRTEPTSFLLIASL